MGMAVYQGLIYSTPIHSQDICRFYRRNYLNYCDMPLHIMEILTMPPPLSVTGEVYCFPRHQQSFRFGWRFIYHSKGLSEFIPKSIPSVPRSSNE